MLIGANNVVNLKSLNFGSKIIVNLLGVSIIFLKKEMKKH